MRRVGYCLDSGLRGRRGSTAGHDFWECGETNSERVYCSANAGMKHYVSCN